MSICRAASSLWQQAPGGTRVWRRLHLLLLQPLSWHWGRWINSGLHCCWNIHFFFLKPHIWKKKKNLKQGVIIEPPLFSKLDTNYVQFCNLGFEHLPGRGHSSLQLCRWLLHKKDKMYYYFYKFRLRFPFRARAGSLFNLPSDILGSNMESGKLIVGIAPILFDHIPLPSSARINPENRI